LKALLSGRSLKYLTAALGFLWLFITALSNEVPADVGDGITHFNIAQASWYHSEFFLHHWGKPFFILLSSGFTQLGFTGMIFFESIVFLSTIFLAYRILSRFRVQDHLQALFPFLLLGANDISLTLMGGMTEPLFNLALVAALYMVVERKYVLFALIISFMPYMRSEGQLPVLLGAILLLFQKEFRALPFLLLGSVFYSIWGMMEFGDPFWYFTQSPYQMDNDMYGHGSWNHYLLSAKEYLGIFGIGLSLIGIVLALRLAFKKDWNQLHPDLLFFVSGVFFGVVIVHSYFWANGLNASLGLTRIATQGVPSWFILCLIFTSTSLPFLSNIWGKIISAGLLFGLVYLVFSNPMFPKQADAMDRQILQTKEYISSLGLDEEKVYYHHPLFGFMLENNPYIDSSRYCFHTVHNMEHDLMNVFKPGDLIVRDSHFGPVEAGLPLDRLNRYPEWVKIAEFISSEQVNDPRNETEGVAIYQYIPLKDQKPILKEIRTVITNKRIPIKADQEFIDFHSYLEPIKTDQRVRLELTCEKGNYRLVFDRDRHADYSAIELKEGMQLDNTYRFVKGSSNTLYIWNLYKQEGSIMIRKITSETEKFHPFLDHL
jgi:hypothetical protein